MLRLSGGSPFFGRSTTPTGAPPQGAIAPRDNANAERNLNRRLHLRDNATAEERTVALNNLGLPNLTRQVELELERQRRYPSHTDTYQSRHASH